MLTAPARVAVTTESMRHFADSCRGWATVTRNASHHQMMINQARQWNAIADAIDRVAGEDRASFLNDLRAKLD